MARARRRTPRLRRLPRLRRRGWRPRGADPPGDTRATTDPVIAEKLVGDRLTELQEQRRNKVILGVRNQAGLAKYAKQHLIAKAKSGSVTDAWMEQTEYQLQAAVEFLGAGRATSSRSRSRTYSGT